MNMDHIKELAQIVSRNGLTKLEIREDNVNILIEKTAQAPAVVQKAADIPPDDGQTDLTEKETVNFNNLIEVKSPIVGVFYSAPSPDSPSFVSIGDKVRKGDVLCIIEAMKLLNEITAEQDGEVVDICIKNGDIAEFGQVLFKMV